MTDKPGRPTTRPDIIEPEIIPPDRSGRRATGGEPDMRFFFDFDGARHIRVVRMGPVGAVVIGLLIALFGALGLLLIVGAFLIWIPLLALFVAAVLASALLRTNFRRRL